MRKCTQRTDFLPEGSLNDVLLLPKVNEVRFSDVLLRTVGLLSINQLKIHFTAYLKFEFEVGIYVRCGQV